MIGQTLLVAAFGLSIAASVAVAAQSLSIAANRVATTGPATRSTRRPVDTWLLTLTAVSLWGAVARLVQAILIEDTSFAYVAEQTRSGMSAALRFSALWSGAEGSLLLFASLCVSALLVGHRAAPRWQRLGTALVSVGLVVAVLTAANPFKRLDLPPLSGAGMAPILEHFAMVIHPPLLYTGMCLALIPALVRDRGSAHRWALSAMAVLTAALGLGSVWAYVELGWGGWWAWDPIENIALIVWLMLAGGLHWQPLDPERATGTGPLNAVVIWALCWPAVLGGAALTRTSLRTSVHAFADAEGLGAWLWPLVIVAAVGAGLRIAEEQGRTSDRATWASAVNGTVNRVRGRCPGAGIPQAVLLGAALIVAAGTYRPFIGGDGTAGWFYSRSLYPVAIVGAILIGVVPLWKPGRIEAGRSARSRGASVVAGLPGPEIVRWGLPGASVLLAAAVAAGWRAWFQLLLAAALGFGVALVLSSGTTGVARLAGHLGVLFVLFGALAGTASTNSVVRLNPGQAAVVDGHDVEVLSIEIIGEDPLRARAVVLIDGSYRLEPSVSVFPERNLRLPEVSTRTRPWLDSQAVLRDVDADAGALITLLFRPWNQLVWWGVGLLTLAALLLLGRQARTARAEPGRRSAPVALGSE